MKKTKMTYQSEHCPMN